MESWSYVLGGKGHVSNEPILSSNKFLRSKNALMDWELKNQSNFENSLLVSGSQNIENGALGELGYEQLMEKQVTDTSIGDALISKVDGRKNINLFMVTPNSFSLEDESPSRLSNTVMDSDSRGSSFIDLNLGRCSDPRDAQNCRVSKSTSIVSLSESSAPPRRARIGVSSHTAYCQVYGCNKDLRSSKDYHKRHKVCEVHSKTAKVIVNGIEQRFCQQCSRFHLLAEFDDGKRSCRKRLAGHNERRRKPQVGLQSGRNERLLHSFNGFASGRFHGTALTTKPFICQDMLLNGLSHPEKYGAIDWCKRIKSEDGSDFCPPSAIPIANAHLPSKSLFPSYNFEKAFPTFHEDGANTASGSIFNESIDRYPNVMGGRTSSSRSFLQDTSLGNDEFTVFDAASTIQGLSGITDSGCARSLLSSQSQNSSSHSPGIPMAHQLVVPRSNTYYSMGQVKGFSSQASTSGVPNKFPSRVMSSVEGGHLGPTPILIPDNSQIVNFDITDGIYHGSHFVNAKDHIGSEDDTTIDLLQLSSQLQRVDHQKQSMQVKKEMILSVAPVSLNMTSNFFDE